MKIIITLITESKRNGNLQVKIGPKNEESPCPIPLDIELRIAKVPNHPERSSAGIASEIIE